jgi:hypothetical protein
VVHGRRRGQRAERPDHRAQRRAPEDLAQLARAVDRHAEIADLARLVDELVGDRLRTHDRAALGEPRENHPDRRRIAVADLREQLGAVHHRHAHVGHHDVERRAMDLGERRVAAVGEYHRPAVAVLAQRLAQAGQQLWIVVNEQDAARRGRNRRRHDGFRKIAGSPGKYTERSRQLQPSGQREVSVRHAQSPSPAHTSPKCAQPAFASLPSTGLTVASIV